MKEQNRILIEEYIGKVCFYIKWKDVHKQIKLEIEDHLYAIIEENQDRGIEEEEAVQRAIRQMGKAETIGKQLHEIHRPAPDWGILLLVSLFSGIGLMTIYSLQRYGQAGGNYQYLSLGKSIFYIIVGMSIGVALYFVDYKKIQPYSKHIYGFTILMLIFVLSKGKLSQGRPNLYVFGRDVNFIAMSPYLLIISLGGIFTNLDWQQPKKILLGIGVVVVPFFLIAIGFSLVSALLFLVAALPMMYFSGARLYHVLGTSIAFFAIMMFKIGGHSYSLVRLLSFINPYRDPNGVGYMTIQSSKTILSAGFFGRGFAMENISLPQLHTDFIFTYLVYAFGWLAGFVMVALAIIFICRLAKLGTRVQDSYGKLLAIGFALIISLQYIWNILMTLGFVPIVAIGMPFVSYGGLSMIVYFAIIGLISSVYKRRNIGVII
ncbi:FtsW/RodA/SpoVE family cell cycle protein [Irregularibacter muris]|uniref:FtsW/RodA/SpoVE family cell cycle protein n=1 Tax=Irregularibacter muris TaxID=1796619 RepID=A0AAE3HGV6_9FIRM|nr:FtsW/RodA/SpoVE family cell cycle protein [Irregularibacter muris]MCR1898843.1 FtsW/RodA/SpoVE family cell cycle protein [Irregularibacter muris]